MSAHIPDNLTVKVDYHGHWNNVAAGEDDGDEEVVVEGVGQVVEGAGGQVALWK